MVIIYAFWGTLIKEALFTYRKQRSRQKGRDPIAVDLYLKANGHNAVQGLQDCIPLTDHVNDVGLSDVVTAVKRRDEFKAHLAIDSNLMPSKRTVCIQLLKIACSVACNGLCVEDIQAATISVITTKTFGGPNN